MVRIVKADMPTNLGSISSLFSIEKKKMGKLTVYLKAPFLTPCIRPIAIATTARTGKIAHTASVVVSQAVVLAAKNIDSDIGNRIAPSNMV